MCLWIGQREAPLSVLSDISPARGRSLAAPLSLLLAPVQVNAKAVAQPISPLAGEMSDRTERGGSLGRLTFVIKLKTQQICDTHRRVTTIGSPPCGCVVSFCTGHG